MCQTDFISQNIVFHCLITFETRLCFPHSSLEERGEKQKKKTRVLLICRRSTLTEQVAGAHRSRSRASRRRRRG